MTLTGKKVLVTGATGFLGGALVRRLAADGVPVRALVRRPQKGEFLRAVSGVELVPGDITDAQAMQQAAQGCAVVFHVAAALGGDLAHQRKANVEGTHNVMEAAGRAQVERIVHVSTISVYGYNQKGDVTEETPLAPGSDPYSISKAEGEALVREVASKHNVSYSMIRPGMIYGARSNMWTGTMFRIAQRSPTIFIGSGKGSAYPIYVDDVVDLMLLLATHPAAHEQAFNCTPDPSPSWREFLGAYAQLVGHRRWLGIPVALLVPFVWAGAALARPHTQTKDLPDMLRFLQRSVTYKMTKARDLLGWQPKTDLQTGVQKCVPWLREKGLMA